MVPPITGFILLKARTVTSLTIGGLKQMPPMAASDCQISEGQDQAI